MMSFLHDHHWLDPDFVTLSPDGVLSLHLPCLHHSISYHFCHLSSLQLVGVERCWSCMLITGLLASVSKICNKSEHGQNAMNGSSPAVTDVATTMHCELRSSSLMTLRCALTVAAMSLPSSISGMLIGNSQSTPHQAPLVQLHETGLKAQESHLLGRCCTSSDAPEGPDRFHFTISVLAIPPEGHLRATEMSFPSFVPTLSGVLNGPAATTTVVLAHLQLLGTVASLFHATGSDKLWDVDSSASSTVPSCPCNYVPTTITTPHLYQPLTRCHSQSKLTPVFSQPLKYLYHHPPPATADNPKACHFLACPMTHCLLVGPTTRHFVIHRLLPYQLKPITCLIPGPVRHRTMTLPLPLGLPFSHPTFWTYTFSFYLLFLCLLQSIA